MKTGVKISTKLLIGVLFAALVLLQAALWGRHGLPDLWEFRRLNLSSVAENNEIRQRNRALASEVSKMKSGYGAVEREAREELGMIKRGETFFQVIEIAPEEPANQ